MPKDVKKEWMDESLDAAAPAEVLPDNLKSLDSLQSDRQQASYEAEMAPPPAPAMPQAPVAAPQPAPEPISDKDLAKMLEDSAKALLDASHNIDKSNVNLKKILTKLSSGDKVVQEKVDSIVTSMEEMKSKVQSMSEAVTQYRESVVSKNTSAI